MTTQSVTKPTVYVVDDDADMRSSLEGLIAALGHRVLTFASAAQFRQFYQKGEPGCLVLDIFMPRQNGLSLYGQLIEEGKRLPVIFITAHADVTTAVAAMKTGAIEFLEKPFDHGTLADRICKALELDALWRQRDEKLAAADDRIARLSPRERETLQMILDGHSNKVIAARGDITERAVEMRRARIMHKLDVHSVAELFHLAVTHRVMNELQHLQSAEGLAR